MNVILTLASEETVSTSQEVTNANVLRDRSLVLTGTLVMVR